MGINVKVASLGKQQLDAVIGRKIFKVSYTKSLVDDWINQLKLLSMVVESELQSAYSVFVGGFKGNLTYLMHTIPLLRDLLKPLENVIIFNFIPAVTGKHLFLDNNHVLLLLPVRFGGLEIPLFCNSANCEYQNSRKFTSSLTNPVS